MKTINLGIIEDEALIRESLVAYFSTNPTFKIRWAEESVEDFLKVIKLSASQQPDILLLDIQLAGMTGLDGIRFIKEALPEVDIMMLTTFEDTDSIFKALQEGACSYISKRTPMKQIMEAALIVSRGGSFMSPTIARKVVEHFNPTQKKRPLLPQRQQEIVNGILDGLSYQEIADKLFISKETVRFHIKKVYKTLEISSKSELIKKSLRGEI